MGAKKIANTLLVIWLLKSVVISYFIEEPVCRLGKTWVNSEENPILKFVTQVYSTEVDPYFVALPDWLRLQTCLHAYFLAPLYLLLAVGIIFHFNKLSHLIGSFVGPAITYAMLAMTVVEVLGDTPSKDIPLWVLYNIDYPIAGLYIWLAFKGTATERKNTKASNVKKNK